MISWRPDVALKAILTVVLIRRYDLSTRSVRVTYCIVGLCWRTVEVTEVYVATLQRDGSWRRVASTQDNTTSAAEPVTLRRGIASGVACVAVADNACDGASLRSVRPVVHHGDTERRFVRTVETVLKSPVALHRATDLPACRTTAISWYWTTSAPTVLNGRELICITGNHLTATATLIVECKAISMQ